MPRHVRTNQPGRGFGSSEAGGGPEAAAAHALHAATTSAVAAALAAAEDSDDALAIAQTSEQLVPSTPSLGSPGALRVHGADRAASEGEGAASRVEVEAAEPRACILTSWSWSTSTTRPRKDCRGDGWVEQGEGSRAGAGIRHAHKI